MAENEIEAAFRAGFKAGFAVTREGFNGECAYDHLAPDPSNVLGDTRAAIRDEADIAQDELEDAMWKRFTARSPTPATP